MSSTGLLIVSNIKNIRSSITAVKKSVKNLYIHLNIPKNTNPPSWSNEISKIYSESAAIGMDIDVKVLISSIKSENYSKINKTIDILFSDGKFPDICEKIKKNYGINSNAIVLFENQIHDLCPKINCDQKMFNIVVLGGTFDRIHTGHKILLTEAVLHAYKKLVIGVTSEKMIKSKKLWELILPVEQRIKDVKDFLNEIDSTLEYDIVPIDDPFGPTKNDPNMDLIIVSAETLKGGQKVNDIRKQNNLKPLEIHCIQMVELDINCHHHKENKISSGNTRLDLLGTKLKLAEPRPNLPKEPYIIGLTGGIATGKSVMVERFEKLGAFVINCDKIAHELYEPGELCYNEIIEHFGIEIINSDSRINRQKLGSIVFQNPSELDALSNIIWPKLIIESKRRIYKAYEEKKFKVAILEAAVLLKAGWNEECHEIWSMILNPNEAIRRLKIRNNLSEEEAANRLNSQLDNKTVVNQSNVVFSSEWSHEFTQVQANRAWTNLMKELDER